MGARVIYALCFRALSIAFAVCAAFDSTLDATAVLLSLLASGVLALLARQEERIAALTTRVAALEAKGVKE